MTTDTRSPYGIRLVKRIEKRMPTKRAATNDINADTMASAKKVIAEHRKVLKALAKR